MKLIFVYNADSGFFSVAADMAHKIFSPATYPCSLCDITYGIFKIRPDWEEFINHSPAPFVFLHKNEFHADYPNWNKVALPLVLAETNGQLETLIPDSELNALQSVAELKILVLERIDAHRRA
ncbi:MAG: hypothetical protein ABIQ93_01525 [Saprospiraceae bacterium]